MTGEFSTASLVCFPCRKRRSLERFDASNPPPHPCPDCSKPMVNIGTKLQVPSKSDEKGWKRFYDHVTAPYFGSKAVDVASFDEERDVENRHWRVCQLGGTAAGCVRCKEVDRRRPEGDWNRYGRK